LTGEFIIVVVVFGGILSIALYFYLFRNPVEKNVDDHGFDEKAAERLNMLWEEINVLEDKVNIAYNKIEEVLKSRKKK